MPAPRRRATWTETRHVQAGRLGELVLRALRAAAVVAAVLLCAGASGRPAAAGELGLHPEVWAAFESYRESRWPGAFAVSENGRSHGRSACPAGGCVLAEAKRAALQSCREAAESDCVIFALRDEIKLAYRILTAEELSPCPLSPAPDIRVRFTSGETGFDHDRSAEWLTERFSRDERHWLDRHGTVMGLTSSSLRTRHGSIGHVTVDGTDGVRCAGPSDGEVELVLEITIHIAKEIPQETCLYREVLDHERRHETLGREMTEAYAGELEARIAAALARQPFVEVPAGRRDAQVAWERLDDVIDESYAVFRRELSRRQLAIDSQSEYERTDVVCPGEIDKYLP